MVHTIWKNLETLRNQSPLVQNITNFVVMNNTANALLAIGASPIMAHAVEELDDMLSICNSLVINMGTLDAHWSNAMIQAAKKANAIKKPWVLDPVGAGASAYRNQLLEELLLCNPTIIRGNASEIQSLAKFSTGKTKGVDSIIGSNEAQEAAILLSKTYNSVVCISGATDIVVMGDQTFYLSNGDELMTKVTGMGCSATAICGAFAAVIPDAFEATISAMAVIGVVGELAAQQSNGPGSLQVQILDRLYQLSETEFKATFKGNN